MELVDFQSLKISELSIVYHIEEESTKLIELNGTYRIYTYENSLFAFVRE